MSQNALAELPEAITRLTGLISLKLWGNRLTEVPEAITRLAGLTSLRLSHNPLTEVPEAITRLTRLTSLDLRENQLTDVPEVIARPTRLTSLDLSRNQLTEVPAARAARSRLRRWLGAYDTRSSTALVAGSKRRRRSPARLVHTTYGLPAAIDAGPPAPSAATTTHGPRRPPTRSAPRRRHRAGRCHGAGPLDDTLVS